MKRKILQTIAAASISLLMLSACSTASNSEQSAVETNTDDSESSSDDGGEADELTTVRIGMTPFPDYSLWAYAKEAGLDHEFGIDLEFTWLTQVGPSVQALARGSIDIVNTCVSCNFPYYEAFPDLKEFIIANQFKGFNIVGRVDAPVYADLIASGASEAEATNEVFDYIRDRTFVIHEPVYGALIDGMLGNQNMSRDDVKLIDFSDDVNGATAFLGGEGDFYMGGLTQNIKLLLEHPDRFVNMGGSEILGPGGLWYSTIAAKGTWLEENEETALALMSVWYAAANDLREKPEEVLPVVQDMLNEHGATSFTLDEMEFIMNEYIHFPTVEEMSSEVLNPESDLFWEISRDFYENQNRESGDLPENVILEEQTLSAEFFDKFIKNNK